MKETEENLASVCGLDDDGLLFYHVRVNITYPREVNDFTSSPIIPALYTSSKYSWGLMMYKYGDSLISGYNFDYNLEKSGRSKEVIENFERYLSSWSPLMSSTHQLLDANSSKPFAYRSVGYSEDFFTDLKKHLHRHEKLGRYRNFEKDTIKLMNSFSNKELWERSKKYSPQLGDGLVRIVS